MLTPKPPAFAYEIVRGKRKTVAIHVQDGAVQVRAPLRVSKRWIDEFVSAQSAWVLKRLAKEAQLKQAHITLIDGATIHYLGASITLKILLAKRASAELLENELTLRVNTLAQDHIKSVFVTWLKKQAASYMVPRCNALASQLQLAHKITTIRFRITRTTWGHCSSKGIIQFNPLIMLTKPDLIDYLIAHEVCHLQHMNHSTHYWALLSQICNNHAILKKNLRSFEASLKLI